MYNFPIELNARSYLHLNTPQEKNTVDQPKLKNVKQGAQPDVPAYQILEVCTILFSHLYDATSSEARKKQKKNHTKNCLSNDVNNVKVLTKYMHYITRNQLSNTRQAVLTSIKRSFWL